MTISRNEETFTARPLFIYHAKTAFDPIFFSLGSFRNFVNKNESIYRSCHFQRFVL